MDHFAIERLSDTHCHLDVPAFDGDRAAVMSRARAAGVERFVNPGYDIASSRRAVALAAEHADVYAAVGIHPNDATHFDDDWLALCELARQPRVAAIGEVGLDDYWKKVPRAEQSAAFVRQLGLARELNLPVIVHCRDAYPDALDLLEQHARGLRVVMHAFAGGPLYAGRALHAGYWLGIGGPLTYPKAEAMRDVVRMAPLNRLVLETDSPYLPPQPHRGRRNEPAYVALVYERVSQLKGVSLAHAAAAACDAAAELFEW